MTTDSGHHHRGLARLGMALLTASLLITGCGKNESATSSSDQTAESGRSPHEGMSGEGMGMMSGAGGSRVDTGADISNEPLQPQPGMRVYEMAVTGMTCSGCANTISSALRPMQGVHAVRISLANNLCWVMVEKGGPSPTAIADAIQKAGYRAEMMSMMPGGGDGNGDGNGGGDSSDHG